MPRELSGRIASTLIFVALSLLVVALCPRQLVGDGAEYLSSARVLFAGHDPGPTRHFWAYPLLVVPVLHLLHPWRVDPLWAFAVLNVGLLALAWWMASASVPPFVRVAVFFGPVLWWIDKAHTEAFTVAALVIVVATWRDRPWCAMAAAGAASMQNPVLAAVVVLTAVASAWTAPGRLQQPRWWAGLGLATLLALLPPLYYWRSAGVLTRLGETGDRAVGLGAWWAVIAEPNIGLLPHAPWLAVWLMLAVAIVTWRMLTRRDGFVDVFLVTIVAALVLVAFTRTGNINHGGTPGMSRYATWLVPLSIPWLVAAWVAAQRLRPAMTVLALASAAWSVVMFWPARPEQYLRPTPLADWIWRQHPSWTSPPPEVFSDRLNGDEEGWLPVATAGCEKVLTIGRGSGKAESPWPLACSPVSLPAACREAGQLCYANRTREGDYDFVLLAASPVGYRFAKQRAWPEPLPVP